VFFALWGIPFVAIGLYMVLGRFFAKSYQKRRAMYAVTDQRALIVFNRTSLRDTPLKGQPIFTKRTRDGRHATIFVGSPQIYYARALRVGGNSGVGGFGQSAVGQFAFYDVADPDPMIEAVDRVRMS
jgi:hypothetical protein